MPVTLGEWRARIGTFVHRRLDDEVLAARSFHKHLRSLYKLLTKTYCHEEKRHRNPFNGKTRCLVRKLCHYHYQQTSTCKYNIGQFLRSCSYNYFTSDTAGKHNK